LLSPISLKAPAELAATTARAVVANPNVAGVDALPLVGGPTQTYRWIEE
jgi:hypothetical protein